MAELGTAAPVVASPAALLFAVATGVAYAMGRERWSRRTGRAMVSGLAAASFFAGLATVAVALASPLDGAAETSLTAHMVQHVLLLAVAAPLLALGAPVPTLLWALPAQARRRALAFTNQIGYSRSSSTYF